MEQRKMPMLGEARGVKMASMSLVKSCKNRLDAIRLCVQLASSTYENICDLLGIDKGHWSRIMQGQANFPDKKANDLMRVCGNYAPMQYEAWSNGFELFERSKDDRIKELEAQLFELKAG